MDNIHSITQQRIWAVIIIKIQISSQNYTEQWFIEDRVPLLNHLHRLCPKFEMKPSMKFHKITTRLKGKRNKNFHIQTHTKVGTWKCKCKCSISSKGIAFHSTITITTKANLTIMKKNLNIITHCKTLHFILNSNERKTKNEMCACVCVWAPIAWKPIFPKKPTLKQI